MSLMLSIVHFTFRTVSQYIRCIIKKTASLLFLQYLRFLLTDFNDSFTVTIGNNQGTSLK